MPRFLSYAILFGLIFSLVKPAHASDDVFTPAPWFWSCGSTLLQHMKALHATDPALRNTIGELQLIGARATQYHSYSIGPDKWDLNDTLSYNEMATSLSKLLQSFDVEARKSGAARAAKGQEVSLVYRAYRERFQTEDQAQALLRQYILESVFFTRTDVPLHEMPVLRFFRTLAKVSGIADESVNFVWETNLAYILAHEHRELGREYMAELYRADWRRVGRIYEYATPEWPRFSTGNWRQVLSGRLAFVSERLRSIITTDEDSTAEMIIRGGVIYSPLGLALLTGFGYLIYVGNN